MILDLLFLLALASWSLLAGGALLRRLAPDSARSPDAAALALPLGLGTMGLGVLGLGALGLLTPVALMLMLLIPLLAEYTHLQARMSGARHLRRGVASKLPGARPSTGSIAYVVVAAVVLLSTLAMALTPATDGDALCYHLQVPKRFLEQGGLTFDPDLHETIYPLLTELLFAVALVFRGPVACKLVSWLLGLSLALSVNGLARPILGKNARWAGLAALLVPAVSNGMSAALNDVALAAFCNSALLAFTHWRVRPTRGLTLLCALLSGMAVGVKYPALVWVALLCLAFLVETLRQLREARNRDAQAHLTFASCQRLVLFVLVVLAVGGPWYLRAYQATGNPVFPFFRNVFAGAGLDEVLEPAKRPLAVTPVNLLTAIVPLTLEPDRFDSVAHQFGPLFLMALPALVLWRAPRRLLALVLFAWSFFILCLTQRQSMRFVLATVGPWSVAVVWAWHRAGVHRGRASRTFGVVLALVAISQALIPCARLRRVAPLVTGRESPDEYLARCEPTFSVGRWIDRNLPREARLIGQDHRGFYIPRPYTMELAHRRRTGLGTRGEDAGSIVKTLRRRGYTHLLLCPPRPERAIEFDPTLGRLLEPWLERQSCLFRADLADADGVVRCYRLYILDDSGSSTALAADRTTVSLE
jgi:hypothetical protein